MMTGIPLTCLSHAVYSTLLGQTGTRAKSLGEELPSKRSQRSSLKTKLAFIPIIQEVSDTSPSHADGYDSIDISISDIAPYLGLEQCQMERGQRWLIAYASQDLVKERESEREWGEREREKSVYEP